MRALLFETVTGQIVRELEITSWEYDTGILAADSLKVTVPAYTPDAQSMDLNRLLTPLKYGVVLIDDTVPETVFCPAAGFINSTVAAQGNDRLPVFNVSCTGIDRLFEKRHVRLPPGTPLTTPDGYPVPAWNVSLNGFDYGTIMKKLIEMALEFPGASLPIVFEPDRTGTRTRNYLAVDGKPVLEALNDLTNVISGVEYDFQPVLTDSGRISWRFVTAPDSVRFLSGATVPLINIGDGSEVTGWERETTINGFASATVFTGGKQDDKTITAQAVSTPLHTAGFPYFEEWDTSHSTVSDPTTLKAWASGRLQSIVSDTRFKVRCNNLNTLRHGDHIVLDSFNHWDYPDGRYKFRVLSIARSSQSEDWLDLKLLGDEE